MNLRQSCYNPAMKIPVLAISLAVLLVAGCTAPASTTIRGSGNVITANHNVSGIIEVVLAGQGSLIITQTDSESLMIEAEDNIMDKIKVETANTKLTIGFKDATNISPTKPIKYNLSVKNLNSVELSGSGDITMSSLKTGALKASISGSGSVVIDSISADSLDASVSGSGNMAISGTVPAETVDISGSGSFNGNRLECKEAKVTMDGSGTISLRVNNKLDVDIPGSGTVNYLGDPKVTQNISGSGRVNKIGDR